MTLKELTQALAEGTDGILAFIDSRLSGGVVVERYLDGSVELLSYLVVDKTLRGRGLGRTLLKRGATLFTSDLLLAEIEDPRYWTPTAENDTAARLRFYEREHCKLLPLPYIQPSLRPGSPRVRNLLLIAVPKDGPLPGDAPSSLIRDFLREYFSACEGDVTADDADVNLMLSAAPDERIPLLSLSHLDVVRRA
jgi:GNAT superfamily N-acetyltransferase